MQGALDGGLDVPHNEKRFVGYEKEDKKFNAETMKKFIFGGHVAEYMEVAGVVEVAGSIDGSLRALAVQRIRLPRTFYALLGIQHHSGYVWWGTTQVNRIDAPSTALRVDWD